MNSIQQAGYGARIWIASFSKKNSILCLVICVLIFAAPVCTESIDNTGNYNRPAGRYPRSINNNGPMSTHKTTCPKGHYLNATSGRCFPCPENTFISEDNHKNQNCITCKIEDSNENQTWSGNATHGPVFGCQSGYYVETLRHTKPHCRNVECTKCRNCSVSNLDERLPCSNHSNAECCDKMEMVEPGSSICTRKATTNTTTPANNTSSTKCDRHFYLDKSNNTCQPCPLHTYMDKDNHTSNFCFNNSRVTGQDKINGNSSMPETSHNDNFVKSIVIPCVVVGIVLILLVVLICLYKKGKCKAIVGSFRYRGSYNLGESPDTYTFTENGSMSILKPVTDGSTGLN